MKKIILLQLAVLISLVGCGDWKQDPMSGTGALGPGQGKPDTKPEKPALPADYIMMDAPLFKLAKEGEKIEIKLEARVILPNYTMSVQVRNLAQFPGATFDSATNTFAWTPAVGTATDSISEFSLEFVAIATSPGQVAVSREKITKLGVTRTILEPTITEVSSLTSEIREGTSDYFYVKVEDRNAGPTEAGFPSLVARNTPNLPTMSGFVEIGRPSKESSTEFEFVVEINLTKAELTKSRTAYGFELVPISQFQKAGTAKVIEYDVLTSLSAAIATWDEEITAAPGSTIDHQFLVLDPKQEGELTLDSISSLPSGATLTCSSNYKPSMPCRFQWTVPANASGRYEVSAKFVNASSDYADKVTKTNYLDFPILIAAPGSK